MTKLLDQSDPQLRCRSELVANKELTSKWLQDLVQEMFDIVADTGAVGLAAPQIGVNKRIIVIATAHPKRNQIETSICNMVLINPILNFLTKEVELGYEGCLSCGDTIGEVPRFIELMYSGYDIQGMFIEQHASGFTARIIQHKVDHLDGILFLERVINKQSLMSCAQYRERQNKLTDDA